ncbi:MAG TPA: glycoside hydrolase family 16 protein [Mucilaginibacter sp.]|nr:glycoside hydrolase family 16 protein [Mucilaginibacter sp.]
MKIITLCCLFSGTVFLALQSCNKLSSSNNNTPAPKDPGYTINPNTAHVIADYDFNDTTLTNHGWTKTFEDDFNGDLSNWYLLQGGGIQGELECYEPGNATVSGGVLQIAAKKETVTGPVQVDSSKTQTFNYTSAWLLSKSTVSANSTTPRVRIVMRMKAASAYGLTTVFSTFGDNFPVNGEIVCAEISGYKNNQYGTSYCFGTSPGHDLVKGAYQFNPTDGDLSASYHVYTTEWSQNAITYYIDGSLVEVKTAGNYVPNLFTKTNRISINLPVGGHNYTNPDTGKINGGAMDIDYVKVFTSN